MIKWIVIILMFLTAWAVASTAGGKVILPQSKMILSNSKVVLGNTSTGTVVASGTTGQCIGILCGVTYAN